MRKRQKNKKETENLLKGAMGLTATTGVLQGVNIKLKRDEKKRKAKAKKQDEARVKKTKKFKTAKQMEKDERRKRDREPFMGGGMMGRRMGYKKGSKKFPDLTGDGKVTFADILKGRGVINGKKKKKKVI